MKTRSQEEDKMPRAIIIFETRSGNTEFMAWAIEKGLEQSGCEVLHKRSSDVRLDELSEVECVVLGAPTYSHHIFYQMEDFLPELKKVNLKGKIGAAFGAYGWSGESVPKISEVMTNIFGMEVLEPDEVLPGRSDPESLKRYEEFGKKIGEKIKSKSSAG
jgi:flavorubredoxin